MAQTATHHDFLHIARNESVSVTGRELVVPARHAYRVLHVGFTIVPIIAGLDKFFHYLVDWNQYLATPIASMVGLEPTTFMYIVGAIEVIAGIGVFFKPRIFAYVVSAWLIGIAANLWMTGQYYDIALRDLGLAVGAFALGRLSHVFREVHP